MDQGKVVIDADDIFDEWNANNLIRFPLIVCASTGVFYNAQVGGVACHQREVEGFLIEIRFDLSFEKDIAEFDDCSYGCWLGSDYEPHDKFRPEYAKAVDNFLLEKVNTSNTQQIELRFDYERINELTESWWPVEIQFGHNIQYIPGHHYDYNDKKFKGYLHLYNCD